MTTYYLAASGGSDANNGLSSGAAWATLAYANTQLVAGDVLVLLDGSHSCGNYLNTWPSGASGSWITYRAQNARAATLQFSNTSNYKVEINGDSSTLDYYLRFEDLIIDGGGAGTGQSIIRLRYANQVHFDNCQIEDTYSHCVLIQRGANNITIDGCGIYGRNLLGSTNNVDGIYISGGGVDIGTVNITNNTIAEVQHCGINIWGNNATVNVIGNAVYATGAHGIQASIGTTITIEGNTCYGDPDWPPVPGESTNEYGMLYGIYVRGDASGTLGTVHVRNNVVYENDYPAVALQGPISGPVNIYNNTFYNNSLNAVSSGIGGGSIWAYDVTGSPTVRIKNNISVIQATDNNYSAYLHSTNPTYDIDYNLWYGSPQTILRGGTTYSTWANYAAASLEPNSIFDDNPDFTSPTTNFVLQSTSPAIDSGVDVGITYGGDAPDMGAFEYSGGGSGGETSGGGSKIAYFNSGLLMISGG